MSRTRWIGVGAVLLVAIVVGIFFGYLAGIALALGVLTVFLLGFGWSAEVGVTENWGRAWGEKLFGSDAAKRREH
jgi:hypothetical protein